MKESRILCDVCCSEINHKDYRHIEPKRMQLLRNFDDSDGRNFYKHLVTESIHVCSSCYNKVLDSGSYLIDERVQGYGNIVLKKEDNQ